MTEKFLSIIKICPDNIKADINGKEVIDPELDLIMFIVEHDEKKTYLAVQSNFMDTIRLNYEVCGDLIASIKGMVEDHGDFDYSITTNDQNGNLMNLSLKFTRHLFKDSDIDFGVIHCCNSGNKISIMSFSVSEKDMNTMIQRYESSEMAYSMDY